MPNNYVKPALEIILRTVKRWIGFDYQDDITIFKSFIEGLLGHTENFLGRLSRPRLWMKLRKPFSFEYYGASCDTYPTRVVSLQPPKQQMENVY